MQGGLVNAGRFGECRGGLVNAGRPMLMPIQSCIGVSHPMKLYKLHEYAIICIIMHITLLHYMHAH